MTYILKGCKISKEPNQWLGFVKISKSSTYKTNLHLQQSPQRVPLPLFLLYIQNLPCLGQVSRFASLILDS